MEKEMDVYDYRNVRVKPSMASLYKNAYHCFGWILICPDETSPTSDGNVELTFQRHRKIRNKAELTRLQRNFDACASEISEMEESKTDTASKVSCGVSIVGSVFLCCSALLSAASQMVACILMAIPGLLGWLSPVFLYKAIIKKKGERVAPLVDQKYNEIQLVCQKAYNLLDRTD